jgi:hypothetical protein
MSWDEEIRRFEREHITAFAELRRFERMIGIIYLVSGTLMSVALFGLLILKVLE